MSRIHREDAVQKLTEVKVVTRTMDYLTEGLSPKLEGARDAAIIRCVSVRLSLLAASAAEERGVVHAERGRSAKGDKPQDCGQRDGLLYRNSHPACGAAHDAAVECDSVRPGL